MSVIDPSLESRLSEAVEIQACSSPDLYFVTEDGARVPAHRSIVSMQSKFLHEVISDYPAHLTPSIQVPWISYTDMCSIVSILYTGEAWQGDESVELEELCEYLGMTNLKLKISGQRTAVKAAPKQDLDETLDESIMETDANDDQEQFEEQPQRKKFKRGPKSKLKSSLMNESSSVSGAELSAMACKICPDAIFKTTSEFEKHLVEDHFSSELVEEFGNEEDKVCEICEQSFESLEALGRHIGSSHSKVIPLYEEKIQKYSKTILEKYSSDKTQCSLCKIKYRNSSLLSAHIGSVHEKFKEFLAEDSRDNDLEVL